MAYTWRPGQGDVTPNDAFMRARRWFTAALAQNYSVDARTERWPNAEWAEWAEAGTTVIADVRVDCSGCPPDTDSAVHRAITIRQSAVTGDRVTAIEPELVVWATVIHQDGQWLVDRISY
ncbi:MAG: hypothetical protein H5T78_02480 [Nocardia sp.]|nr:hypothetical protein [Nocardia sp.]